jgi:pyruvate/2-oxoglutarate dehydrogenase complex dihydrolipoamide dehydrogenase (E3) component
MSVSEYDIVVIGSGPAGQKGAIAAAKARKRVAMIDRAVMIGGVSVHTGTIPSKTIREAVFQLTGFAVKALYGNGSRSRVDISVQDVSTGVGALIRSNECQLAGNCQPTTIAISARSSCLTLLPLLRVFPLNYLPSDSATPDCGTWFAFPYDRGSDMPPPA